MTLPVKILDAHNAQRERETIIQVSAVLFIEEISEITYNEALGNTDLPVQFDAALSQSKPKTRIPWIDLHNLEQCSKRSGRFASKEQLQAKIVKQYVMSTKAERMQWDLRLTGQKRITKQRTLL